MLGIYPQSPKIFPKPNFARLSGRWRNVLFQIFFQSVHPGVSGKGSNFAIFSANRRWPLQLLYCDTHIGCSWQRKRGDLIETFKLVKGITKVDHDPWNIFYN